jgi:hypothetical protein
VRQFLLKEKKIFANPENSSICSISYFTLKKYLLGGLFYFSYVDVHSMGMTIEIWARMV